VLRRSQEDGKTRSFSFTSSRLPVFLFILLSPAAWGCSTHQCDASTGDASGGQATEFDGTWTWQSSSIQTGWMPYNGNETITFTLPATFLPSTSTPGFTLAAYVSTGSDQWADGGGQFVGGGGQLAEFQIIDARRFTVFNDTCANYYLRVVVTAYGPAPVDAGADAPHD
jgi:hypothetical protein